MFVKVHEEKEGKWNTEGTNHGIKALNVQKKMWFIQPQDKTVQPNFCLRKAALHRNPTLFLFFSDLIQLPFWFPKTAVTELVQSTLLWNDEPGNFQKKKIFSVAFPLLQTDKFACCK